MTALRVLLARLRALGGGARRERELDEELETHLALLADDHARRGLSPAEARAAARAAFGGVEQTKEAYRDQRGLPLLESLARDVRLAARGLRRSPGFAAVLIVTLGLGIGANTAVFGVLDALVLRPLPVAHAGELVRLQVAGARGGDDSFSYPAFRQLRDRGARVVDLLAASGSHAVAATVDGQPEVLSHKVVSDNYFAVLGVGPAAGRTLTAGDDDVGAGAPVAVLSHGYWTRRFGRAPRAVGATIALGATTFTVVGVAGPQLGSETVGDEPDLWTPLTVQPGAPGDLWTGHSTTWLRLVGRRRPGADLAAVRAALAPVYAGIAREAAAPMNSARFRADMLSSRLAVQDGSRGLSPVRERLSRPLWVVTAAVALILLIACANVANLLLARAAVRRREMSLHLALGAGRRRLVRRLLVEALLLAALGGALGLLLGHWGSTALAALIPRGPVSLRLDVGLDARVLAFTGALSLVTAVLFGLVPALRTARPDVMAALKEAGPGVAAGRFRLGKAVVVVQIALSLVLLVGAGLFMRSLAKLRGIDLGFNPAQLLVLRIEGPPPGAAMPPEQRRDVYAGLVEQAEQVPGVRAASLSFFGLFSGGRWGNKITVEGRAAPPDEPLRTQANSISPRYFEVMGIRVLRGRPFSPRDREGAQPVAIVNETFARQFLDGADALGRRVALGAPPKAMMTVVGLVADAKYGDLRERAAPMLYVPFTQHPGRLNELEVRTAGDPAAVADQVRRALARLDQRMTVIRVAEMQDQVDASITGERLTARLSFVFGLLALALTAIGVYGVIAYTCAQRTVEIGVRMALGAGAGSVIWLVVRQVLALVAAGALLGGAAAALTGRLVAAQLYGVAPHDPVTIALALAALVGMAVAAGCIPARRAARLNPVIALRAD